MAGERNRVCANCGQSKSIRGVWYLHPAPGAPRFRCETCHRSSALASSLA
ncbi:MAG TPA: hypothetical protein VHH36_04670 [Candidatus Thermoplasmatota archaeon]|nr:hypothetical protein [Candidatus Thermoplasmatota archaeon]